MTLLQDIFTKIYRLFFAMEKPTIAANLGARSLNRNGLSYLGLSTFWWYLWIVAVSFSPVLGTIYKIYRARKSCKKGSTKQLHSQLKTKQPNLIPVANNNLISGACNVIHSKNLERSELSHGHEYQENSESCYQDQLNWSLEAGDGQCTESNPYLGPRMIKLFIKKPSSFQEAFQDNKRKLVYSLMSPAQKAKRSKQVVNGNTESRAPVNASTSEHIYNTAKSIVDKTDHLPIANEADDLPLNMESKSSIQQEFVKSNSDKFDLNSKSIRRQLTLGQDLPENGKSTLPTSKSPKKKKGKKKKQHKRSIFSKSLKTQNEAMPDHPLSEADSNILTFESKQDHYKNSQSQKQQMKATAKVRRRVALLKRNNTNQVCKNTSSFHCPFYTESATQELKNLIRQVESENHVRKSVSPRPSETFVGIQVASQTLYKKKSKKKEGETLLSDLFMELHPTLPSNNAERKRMASTGDVPSSRAKTQQSYFAGNLRRKSRRSGQYARSEDNSCCTKGVSVSILSKIASMSSQDRSSIGSGVHKSFKHAKILNEESISTTQPLGNNDYYKACVKASRRQNFKQVSSELKHAQRDDHTNDNREAKNTKSYMQSDCQLKLAGKQTFSRKPFEKNKPTPDSIKYVQRDLTHNLEYPSRTFHTRSILPVSRERSALVHPRRRPVVGKRQDSASASLSSHYSFLGCIGPSESTIARNLTDKHLSNQKSPENLKAAVRKFKNKAQPIEGYILNSKTPIANTLLLCRSGITTTYENWTTEEAHGPGKVKAISKTCCTNRFPSLSSYLDHLEKKGKLQNNLRKSDEEYNTMQSIDLANLTKQRYYGAEKEKLENFKPQNNTLVVSKGTIDEQPSKKKQDLSKLDVTLERFLKNETKIQTSPAGAIVNDMISTEENKKKDCIKNPNIVQPKKNSINVKQPQRRDSNTEKQISAPRKTSEMNTQINPIRTDEKKNRQVRPKLRFKYLPLTKQPLPFSSPTKSKPKSSKADSAGSQEPKREANLAVTGVKCNAKPYTTIISAKNSNAKKLKSQTELKTGVANHTAESKETNNDKLLYVETVKPVVVNLRKFCKRSSSSSNHVRAQLQGSAERLPIPKTSAVASAADSSPSVDLQSLLEMAKSVLKRSKSYIAKTKKEKTVQCASKEPDLDQMKSDDQTSESYRCKCSHITKKEPVEVKFDTVGDQSYTQLYKSKELRGLKPWRTTKAFTNRLKLMLQNSKEHCMKQKNEKLSEQKRVKQPKKAYVVHKAKLTKFHLYQNGYDESLEKDNATKRTSVLRGRSSFQTKIGKESHSPKVSKVNVFMAKNKAPVLRTEALANRRSQNINKKHQEKIHFLTKKKTEKSRGTPLLLTDTQLYNENSEKALECELTVHSANPHRGTMLSKSRRVPVNEGSRRPFIGMDPAQVARLNEKALKMTNSSACSTAQSRENQVQNELSVLLEKMKTRNTSNSPNIGLGVNGDDRDSLCHKENTTEKLCEKHSSLPVADLTEHINSGDACNSSASRENVAVSDRSGNHNQPKDDKMCKNTMIQAEFDNETPTAALKFLLQCACSKFHSMPNLPDSSNGSSTKLESISRERKPCAEENLPIEVNTSEFTKETGQVKFCANDGKDNGFDYTYNKSDEKSKFKDFVSAKVMSKTNDFVISKKLDVGKSNVTTFQTNKKKRKAWRQSSLMAISNSQKNKHLNTGIPSFEYGAKQRKGNFDKTDTSTKIDTKENIVDNKKSNVVDTLEFRKMRINTVQKPVETLIDLPRFREFLENGEVHENFHSRTELLPKADKLEQPSNAVLKNMPTDRKACISEVFCDMDNSKIVRQQNPQDQNLPGQRSISCPPFFNRSPKEFNGCFKRKEDVASNNPSEAGFPDIDASRVSILEKEATVTSGCGTVEISPKSVVCLRSKRVSCGFVSPPNTVSKRPCKGFNIMRKSALNDLSCEQFSSQVADSLNDAGVSVRKSLSHISEESNNSEANLHVSFLESCKQEILLHDKGAKTPTEERVLSNKEWVLHLPHPLHGVQQHAGSSEINSVMYQTQPKKDTHFRDGDSDKQGYREAKTGEPAREDLEEGNKPFLNTETSFKAIGSTSQHNQPCLSVNLVQSLSGVSDFQAECKTSEQQQQDKTITPSSSIVTVKSITKTKQDIRVFGGKKRLQDIPVTVIYTNQNSDVPELSFTNEDEYSLDSWTQNSFNFSKKSLESGPKSETISKLDKKIHSKVDRNDICKSATADERTQKLSSSEGGHDKLSPDSNEKARHKEMVNTNKNTKISENGVSICEDFRNDKKDLESLLDSALDQTSGSKSEGTSLVFTKLRARKPRNRRIGIRRIGCNREILRGGNTDSLNLNKTLSKTISIAKSVNFPPNLKTSMVSLKTDLKNNQYGNITTGCSNTEKEPKACSSRKIGFKSPLHIKDSENNDDQTLQEILKQVPAQPFGVTRNRKMQDHNTIGSGKEDQMCQRNISSPQILLTSFDIKENCRYIKKTIVKIDDIESHGISVQLKPDVRRNGSEISRKHLCEETVKQTCFLSTKASDEDHNRVKIDIKENNDCTTLCGAVQEYSNSAVQEPANIYDEIEQGEDEETLKEKTKVGEAESCCSDISTNKVRDDRDVVGCIVDNFSLSTKAIDYSTQRITTQLSDQDNTFKEEICHRESPCSSKSSSIVLSWVGSHQESDVEACYQSEQDTNHPEPFCAFEDTRMKISSGGLQGQSSSSRYHRAFLNSELLPAPGTFNENNINENNIKTEMEHYRFQSQVIEESPTVFLCDDNVSYDDNVELDTLSTIQNDRTYEKSGYTFLYGKNKNGATILEQESYLHNLVEHMKWDTHIPNSNLENIGGPDKPQTKFEHQTNKLSSQLSSKGQNLSERDSRCGYVMSAWTNQRQHSDLGLGLSSFTVPNQRSSPVRDTDCSNLNCSKALLAENKLTKSRRTQVVNVLETPIPKVEVNRKFLIKNGLTASRKKQDDSPLKTPITQVRQCSSNDSNSKKKPIIQVGLRSTQTSKRMTKRSSHLCIGNSNNRDVFGIQSNVKPSCGKSIDGAEKENLARTLEEHLRLCSDIFDNHVSPTGTPPDTRLGGGRRLPSLHDHLSTMSNGVLATEGDESAQCQYSLNWYRPQSLSSSNSMNASHATEQGRPGAESTFERLDDRGTNQDSYRNEIVRSRERLNIGDIMISNCQAAQPAAGASRLDGQIVDTNLRGNQRCSNKRVCEIVEMFEMKNSNTKQG